MNPYATKSHLSVDTKNNDFLLYQKVMHSLAVTVTEVTKGCARASVPFVTVTKPKTDPRHQLERMNHANAR